MLFPRQRWPCRVPSHPLHGILKSPRLDRDLRKLRFGAPGFSRRLDPVLDGIKKYKSMFFMLAMKNKPPIYRLMV